MRAFFVLLSALLLAAAWLLPFHKTPWTTFGSELLTFGAAFSLLGAFIKQPFKVAKPQWLVAWVLLIPLLQLAFGQVLYLSNALLTTGYLLSFWLMIVAGYNLSLNPAARETLFKRFCLLLIAVGLLSSLIAVLQWLHLIGYFAPFMNYLKGNRPYANFAQPNNLATFLTMSVLACLYLYEKRLCPKIALIPISLVLIFTIVLTQSRTSWVVALFILGYWGIKSFNRSKRLSMLQCLAWVGIFVGTIFLLPYINSLIESFSHQQVISTSSVVQRASSGYLRFDMWTQGLVAIGQQPWFGYGWNQTGMAQIAAFDLYPSHEWYKSAHNVVLDLLIWNGIPIGALILLYLTGWLYWLNKGAKESVSIIAMLMVSAILIHALLEFPIHYAYFLLPMGFLLGMIQAQYPRLPSIDVPPNLLRLFVVVGIIFVSVVYHDYHLYRYQNGLAYKKQLNAEEQLEMQEQIWVLTQFKDRLRWIQLDPRSQLSETELQHFKRVVANSASSSDILKYARVLAFNGKKAEAEHQLWILKELHGQTKQYADLIEVSVASTP